MEILNEIMGNDIVLILAQLILALILGGLIGLEREKKTRSAGFRTYSLVCLGAALVMMIGEFIYNEFDSTSDIARLGAQVVSGIGFLGAGAIINSGTQKVIGLTTAAALWTCGCIGLAVGIGFYTGAIIACLLTIVLLRVLSVVDKKYREKEHFVDFYLELYNANEILQIVEFFDTQGINIVSLKSTKPKLEISEIGVDITVRINATQSSNQIARTISEISNISVIHKVYV